LQEPIAQTPPPHEGVALAKLHTLPQAPQFAVLVERFTSQPLDGLPSQLPYGRLQVATAHAPPLQVGIALARLHAAPQLPQLATLVERLASQPLAAVESQLAYDPLHAMPQAPPPQVAVALAGTEQVCPHAPQLRVSDERLLQVWVPAQ